MGRVAEDADLRRWIQRAGLGEAGVHHWVYAAVAVVGDEYEASSLFLRLTVPDQPEYDFASLGRRLAEASGGVCGQVLRAVWVGLTATVEGRP